MVTRDLNAAGFANWAVLSQVNQSAEHVALGERDDVERILVKVRELE